MIPWHRGALAIKSPVIAIRTIDDHLDILASLPWPATSNLTVRDDPKKVRPDNFVRGAGWRIARGRGCERVEDRADQDAKESNSSHH
jgi:hypothetical protein